MIERFTDEEIAAEIFDKLNRKRCWGGKYKPYKSVVSWLEAKVRKNGKRIKGIIDNLVKDRYLLVKKGGNVLSLNTRKKEEIKNTIKKKFDKDTKANVY